MTRVGSQRQSKKKGFYYKIAILNFYIKCFITKKLVSWLKFIFLKHRDIILSAAAKMQDLAVLLTKKTPNIRRNGQSSNKKRTLSMAVVDSRCRYALHLLHPGYYLLT